MWTPKRILILIGGLTLFLVGYGIYAYFLGGIDGLPPLPDDWAWKGSIELPPPENVEPGDADKKLQQAFGPECQELSYTVKLDLPSRGWVLATNSFEPRDGRVEFKPFSACIFPKGRPDAKFPEINTVQCEEAYLTLDKAVTSMLDLGNRKILRVELRGRRITIKNNRQTPNLSDDIEVAIIQSPLFYDAPANLIHTDGAVELLDLQTRPHPTKINAIGLELHLTKDAPPVAGKPDKNKRPKGEPINGVDKLVLKSNVDMWLSVDARSGFLGDAQGLGRKPPPPQDAGPEKSQVNIKTPGSLVYDLVKELAIFQGLKGQGQPISPDQVIVKREHKIGETKLLDQLDCDHLELHFRRKPTGESGGLRDGKSVDKEIDSAYAKVLRQGDLVKLAMETENLHAWGLELLYRAPSETTGPQTILKGQPLHAIKDGHKIEAVELHLIGADKHNQGQQALATGPGRIDLFDKANPARPYPLHALWKDKLTASKVKEGNRLFDLLTLTKEASFIDEEHKQELHGERLEVLLEPTQRTAEPGAPPPPQQSTSGAPRQRPYKIDAFENVRAFSLEFIVKNAQILQVRFRDDLPVDDHLPDAAPPAPGTPVGADPKIPPAAPPDKAKLRPPIELEARQVTAIIKRGGSKDQLHKLIAQDDVHVHQEGAKPEDKGVNIHGCLLELEHHPLGDVLYVHGDATEAAKLQLNELFLTGPKVTINQQYNTAEIAGAGMMDMPSNTTFDGGKPAKKDTRLKVYWKDDMEFDGVMATFKGNVQANQDNAYLRCQKLTAKLDRRVSFKEGRKDDQNAKVDKIVCYSQVTLVEELRDSQKNYRKFYGLAGTTLDIDNLDEKALAHGPAGQVLILAPGSDVVIIGPGPNPPPHAPTTVIMGPGANPAGPAKGPPSQELKLTRIFFDGWVYNNRKNNQRIARFYDNVRVLHGPANRPDAVINPDKPKKDEFYLKCEELTVYSRPIGDNKSSQIMNAKKNVDFKTDTFYGRAYSVQYDESSDQIVFEGKDGVPALLYQQHPVQREIKAGKILYNRKTGAFSIDRGSGLIQLNWRQEKIRNPYIEIQNESEIRISEGAICHHCSGIQCWRDRARSFPMAFSARGVINLPPAG